MKNLSPQTKSFIILFTVAVVGAYVALLLTQNNASRKYSQTKKDYTITTYAATQPATTVLGTDSVPAVDTGNWKEYADSRFNLSFKYAPGWQVKPAVKKGDYNIIEIDPGKKYYNFRVYVSEKDYFVMDGLPTKETDINGVTALNVSNVLFGIKHQGYYYTFDLDKSLSLTPEFNALVHSVKFGESD